MRARNTPKQQNRDNGEQHSPEYQLNGEGNGKVRLSREAENDAVKEKQYFTAREIAEILDLQERTVTGWTRRGLERAPKSQSNNGTAFHRSYVSGFLNNTHGNKQISQQWESHLMKEQCSSALKEIEGRMWREKLDRFVPSPDFTKRNAHKHILETPCPPDGEKPKKPPKDLPAYLATLYAFPLLTNEQEQHLFRQYNYLKYEAGKRMKKLKRELQKEKASHADFSVVQEIEALLDKAIAARNELTERNLRLVVSIAKKKTNNHDMNGEFGTLISDGNVSLMKAVEGFDYTRGNRFSTYATWAIKQNYCRSIPKENGYNLPHTTTRSDEIFEETDDRRTPEPGEVVSTREMQRSAKKVAELLADDSGIDELYREILQRKFGLDGGEGESCQNIGSRVDRTKERIGQIAAEALLKLALDAEMEGIPMPEETRSDPNIMNRRITLLRKDLASRSWRDVVRALLERDCRSEEELLAIGRITQFTLKTEKAGRCLLVQESSNGNGATSRRYSLSSAYKEALELLAKNPGKLKKDAKELLDKCFS